MARMTYSDAAKLLDYLDETPGFNDAKNEAFGAITEALGDPDAVLKLGDSMGRAQRARDLDFQASQTKKASKAKKNSVPSVAKDAPMYGIPISQEEWDKIRGMYGSSN